MPKPGTVLSPPGSSSAHHTHWASDTFNGISRKHPQLQPWLHVVHSLVCRMSLLKWKHHIMAHSLAKDHYSSSSWAKSSGYPNPLQTRSPLPDHATRGLSRRPEETCWHFTSIVTSLCETYLGPVCIKYIICIYLICCWLCNFIEVLRQIKDLCFWFILCIFQCQSLCSAKFCGCHEYFTKIM